MHRIRLRGPWEVLSADGDPRGIDSGRLHLPIRWQNAVGDARELRISRRFGCPAELDDDERIWLVVESELEGALFLNERPLGPVQTTLQKFDVTEDLQARNRVELRLHRGASAADPPLPAVALEIGIADASEESGGDTNLR